MRLISKCSATSPTAEPGWAATMSRIWRRVRFPSAANTRSRASSSRSCRRIRVAQQYVTYRLPIFGRVVNTRRRNGADRRRFPFVADSLARLVLVARPCGLKRARQRTAPALLVDDDRHRRHAPFGVARLLPDAAIARDAHLRRHVR